MNLEDCYTNQESKGETSNLLDEKIYLIVVFKRRVTKSNDKQTKANISKRTP